MDSELYVSEGERYLIVYWICHIFQCFKVLIYFYSII